MHLRPSDRRAPRLARIDRAVDGAARHHVIEQRGRLTVLEVPPPNAIDGTDGLLPRLLSWVLERAPGRTARALRLAMGDDRGYDNGKGAGAES